MKLDTLSVFKNKPPVVTKGWMFDGDTGLLLIQGPDGCKKVFPKIRICYEMTGTRFILDGNLSQGFGAVIEIPLIKRLHCHGSGKMSIGHGIVISC